MTALCAHADTSRVAEKQVMAIPAPAFTKTWHPVPHRHVIESLEAACSETGISIVKREYSLNKTGTRMFGVWHLDAGNGSMGYALGLRNAIDKSMVVGVCAGTSVFVCDNLCFSGEFIRFRKHTGGLDIDELRVIGQDAVGGAIIEMEKMVGWQKSLHETWVPRRDRKELIYDMIEGDVFSGSQFKTYLSCLEDEKAIRRGRSLDCTNSLFNLHGAATRMMRGWNLLRVSDASARLNRICDDYTARIAA